MTDPLPVAAITARDIVDSILRRVANPEDCYEESELGSQLIPALAALRDHEIDGYGFQLKQRFGICKTCRKSSTQHPNESCAEFTFGSCPDFSAAKNQRWWGSIRAARSALFAAAPRHREPNGLPSIEISDVPLRTLSERALAALQARNDPPVLFSRSGEMVQIHTDETNAISLRSVTESALRGYLTRTADYLQARKESLTHVPPPLEIVRDIQAQSAVSWNFPPIRGVTEIPSIRPDGSILQSPGYDPATGIFYSSASVDPGPILESPTLDNVMAARQFIEEAIGEFPWDSRASLANIYALLLTPILRSAIDGNVPLAVIDAPQAGTGKGLLVDVAFVIATGRNASMVPYPRQEEEMVKQISACLWAGRPMICFDNLESDLRSPNLALALTAKYFECRIMGVSKNMIAENRATWVVTGNNVKPAGDMPRRCYQIRIDASSSKPYEGREFKHPNLPKWVNENRGMLLRALLTIVRYWYSRGCPSAGAKPWGSFEEWQRIVAGVLRAAQIPGFLENRRAFDEEEDESPREWELFLQALDRRFPGDVSESSAWFRIADVMAALQETTGQLYLARPSEIISLMEKPRSAPTIALGKMFQWRRGRRFGYRERQYWIERRAESSDHRGSAEWRVVSSGQ